MSKMHVHIIKMGGTIEFFDPAFDTTLIKKLMKLDVTIDGYLKNIIKPHFTYSVKTVAQKDSRELNQQDRLKLLKEIQSVETQNIIVTQGTFTMRHTAHFLHTKGVGDKKVIFTGSMIPISGFSTSDAGFNLGFATGSLAGLEPGVYISMNGGVFRFDEVDKNVDLFRFE